MAPTDRFWVRRGSALSPSLLAADARVAALACRRSSSLGIPSSLSIGRQTLVIECQQFAPNRRSGSNRKQCNSFKTKDPCTVYSTLPRRGRLTVHA